MQVLGKLSELGHGSEIRPDHGQIILDRYRDGLNLPGDFQWNAAGLAILPVPVFDEKELARVLPDMCAYLVDFDHELFYLIATATTVAPASPDRWGHERGDGRSHRSSVMCSFTLKSGIDWIR